MKDHVIFVLKVAKDGEIVDRKVFEDTPEGFDKAEGFFVRCIGDTIEDNEGASARSIAMAEPDFQKDLDGYIKRGYFGEYGEHVYLFRSKVE